MQFLTISNNTKLSELSELVGARNVSSILHINNISRTPNVGREFSQMCETVISDTEDVSFERKSVILSSLTQDSDIFEAAALTSSSGWKLLSSMNVLPNMLKIPEDITLPDSAAVLGNGQPVSQDIYNKIIGALINPPHSIDPVSFNEYSGIKPGSLIPFGSSTSNNGDPMQWFRIPWGTVSLYSSLSDERIDFPVYPEEVSDGIKANYVTMPDLLYQYEPWQIYNSSGPRTQSFTFDFHRDMWTGDHRDGRANDLIRACMANCYPEYRGSAVYTSTVTLYIDGNALITGILTDVSTAWDGPLGLDNFYLHCKLTISITEVSSQPLDFHTVRNKPLIG